MKVDVRRRFAAWLLLLVYVPVMVAVSLHVHEDEAAECEQCAQHIRHNGHLDAYADNVNDCVLCQFASLPYVTPAAVVVAVAFFAFRVVYAEIGERLRLGVCDVKSARAPPCFLVMSYKL